ncbi:MAG: family metallo-hydrolase [Oscillospiraceae bacterium]|nr:family metallo-hydrolase [Oscillospiraceae bacterium]
MEKAVFLVSKMDSLSEILIRLERLVTIDTSVSQGRELPAAEYLKAEFERQGIPAAVYEPFPGRGSVIAELAGHSPETLLILTHLDTADFLPGARNRMIRREDRYYGRGTLDCKGLAAIWTQVLCDLYRDLGCPKRSVRFIAAAGEESGGMVGMDWLSRHTDCLRQVFLALGEGGGFPVAYKGRWLFTLQTGELAREPPLEAIYSEEEQLRIVHQACQQGYYSGETLDYFRDLQNAQTSRRVSRESFYRGVDTLLGQGDCTVLSRYAGLFQETLAAFDPGYGLLPVITPGWSDNRFARRAGIDTIGFFPLSLDNRIGGIHGRNEYINKDSIYLSYKYFYDILKILIYYDH